MITIGPTQQAIYIVYRLNGLNNQYSKGDQTWNEFWHMFQDQASPTVAKIY